ncbi:hypothetical protein F9K92_16895 [Stenotrophomonas rhizophila]|uniref:Uncharacterized protein n=1 Tax=Stenotrophomonas rhizophila TaxID=216778 RepID=A0A7V7YDC9_9GAMM|nr:hypothetical protein F9K92_16895 [Stenotrophomonas rhizophila]
MGTDAVNVRQLNDVLTQSNEYTGMAVEGLNKRLDGMDKRFNRMAAMSSAKSAMAMNTAGLNTYNRRGITARAARRGRRLRRRQSLQHRAVGDRGYPCRDDRGL